MPYLICDKCGKIFKLKEGESPNDPQNLRFWDRENKVFHGFECECGESELKYVQNFGAHFDEELDPINELNICPDCGKILEGDFCKECGFKPKRSKKSKRNQDIKK